MFLKLALAVIAVLLVANLAVSVAIWMVARDGYDNPTYSRLCSGDPNGSQNCQVISSQHVSGR
jgi:hypothetical protein